jgi:plastocyanin
MNGFLGTGATFRADLNLVVQVSMGLALLVGMFLAKRKKFRAHKYVQSSVMILNLAMIFLIMAPSFHKQVQPQVPGGLKEAYYLVPHIHATLGTIAEVLGLYIVLVAATKLLPRKLKFKRYKPWMRTELALWWIVVLLGVGTYYVWYIGSGAKTLASKPSVAASTPAAPEKISVKISNFQFEPKELTIKAGTIVEWTDERGRHTVEADDGSFVSDTLTADGKFEHKFDTPGVFPYYCSFHGDKHGKDMAGVITVTPRDQ